MKYYYIISDKIVGELDLPMALARVVDGGGRPIVIKDLANKSKTDFIYETKEELEVGSFWNGTNWEVSSKINTSEKKDWNKEIDRCISINTNEVAVYFNYESFNQAISYVGSSIAQYHLEAQQLLDYRDACWLELNNIQKAIKQNLITSPEKIKEYLPAKPIKKVIEN